MLKIWCVDAIYLTYKYNKPHKFCNLWGVRLCNVSILEEIAGVDVEGALAILLAELAYG